MRKHHTAKCHAGGVLVTVGREPAEDEARQVLEALYPLMRAEVYVVGG